MPRKVETYRPPWLAAKDESRPSSHRRGYGGRNWAATRRQVIVRDCSTCQQCQRIVSGTDCQVDHIVPKKRGGTDTLSNLQVLCLRCHQAKTARGD